MTKKIEQEISENIMEVSIMEEPVTEVITEDAAEENAEENAALSLAEDGDKDGENVSTTAVDDEEIPTLTPESHDEACTADPEDSVILKKNEDSIAPTRPTRAKRNSRVAEPTNKVIFNGNDLITAEMPDVVQAGDIDEMNRAIAHKKSVFCASDGGRAVWKQPR